MKSFTLFLLVLLVLCVEKAHMMKPEIEAEGGQNEVGFQADVWAVLSHLTVRVTAAENMVEELQGKNAAMEARMTAVENLAEELQMEHDAQALELDFTQRKFNSMQERLTVDEDRIKQLEKQQEVQNMALQKLQNTNEVRKVAFSASLLASGEGNTMYTEFLPLIYKNIIANIGNYYNRHTGFFTAPVRGVYYFRFTGHIAHSAANMRMGLVRNGHLQVTAGDRLTTSADAEDNASNGAVLHLDVGDVVSVQLIGNIWDDQYHRSTFSGFLLFEF